MTPNKKFTIAIECTSLVAQIACWMLVFRLGCLVSRECRQMRREFAETGDCIDPIKPLVARMETLIAKFDGQNN